MAFTTKIKDLTNDLPEEALLPLDPVTNETPREKFIKTCLLYIGDVSAKLCLLDKTSDTTAVTATVSLWGYSEGSDKWVYIQDVNVASVRGGSADVTDLIAPFDRIHVNGARANTIWYLALTANTIGR